MTAKKDFDAAAKQCELDRLTRSILGEIDILRVSLDMLEDDLRAMRDADQIREIVARQQRPQKRSGRAKLTLVSS